MFKNSGKKIMGFVKFVYFLNLILAVVIFAAGIYYTFTQYGSDPVMMVVSVIVFGLIAVIYMLAVFFSLLTLYAFGELAQSNVQMQNLMGDIQVQVTRIAHSLREPVRSTPRREDRAPETAPEPAPQPSPIAPIVEDDYYAPQPAERPVSYAYNYKAPAGAPVYPVNPGIRSEEPAAPALVFCTKCGGKHDASATTCRYCGTPLQ